MALDPRGKRTVKRKAIYSPSDPSRTEYHLIHVQELQKDFIVKTSSNKQQTNGKVLISVEGEDKQGHLITSGTRAHCEIEFNSRLLDAEQDDIDEETDSDESVIADRQSTRVFPFSPSRTPGPSFSQTPLSRRTHISTLINNGQSSTNSSSDANDLHRSRSDIDLYHKLPSPRRAHENAMNSKKESTTDRSSRTDDQLHSVIESRVNDRINKLLRSLNKKLDFMTKKVQQISQSPGYWESNMSIYRNEKDQFPEEVKYENENLLDFHGKNPGDYGRRLLRILYSELELKTSMLPSSVSDRYAEPKLDEERFAILNSAMRIKYRINEHHYQEFYKNLVRKKLSGFLLEEERRCRAKAKRCELRQATSTITAAAGTEEPSTDGE